MLNNRYLVGGLALSVVVNLVLVGMFLGRASVEERPPRLDPTMGMRPLLSALPEARRKVLAPLARDYFSAMRPRFRDIRSAQSDLSRAMVSEPLDEAALRAALNAFNQHLYDSQATARDALVVLARNMTLEERQQLTAYLSRPGRRPDGRPPKPGAVP